MSSVTLNPTKDAYIANSLPTTNTGGSSFVDAGEWKGGSGDARRALLQFNLSPYSGYILSSAKLRVYDTGTDLATNTRTLRAYRLKRSWAEGDSSAGSGATWNTYDGSNNWGTAGASNTTSVLRPKNWTHS